ncbi:hypothetical protein K439DRAFT_445328 [Ramaria rubella]|nr:hypothetical protein K439DRAFT_445328 [Ramaria rubella]
MLITLVQLLTNPSESDHRLTQRMSLNTSTAAGLSTRTYAQVIKETLPRPRALPCSPTLDLILEDGWSDVSSVTSCSWPGSEDADSVSSTETQEIQAIQPIYLNLIPVVKTIEEVPWIDEDLDTRAPYALAGRIKHINRSRWLHTNIGSQSSACHEISASESESHKPWRRYPGCRSKYCHRNDYLIRKAESKERETLQREVRVAKKFRE